MRVAATLARHHRPATVLWWDSWVGVRGGLSHLDHVTGAGHEDLGGNQQCSRVGPDSKHTSLLLDEFFELESLSSGV